MSGSTSHFSHVFFGLRVFFFDFGVLLDFMLLNLSTIDGSTIANYTGTDGQQQGLIMGQPMPKVVTEPPTHKRSRWTLIYRLLWLLNHWVPVFILLFGIFILLPFLAPVFMHMGWTAPAGLIYTLYSTQCHQMAQRSIFLFGPQPMYSIAQLPVLMTNDDSANLLALRAFVGNADLGWKVAWSDRMVSMYGSLWLAAIAFGLLGHRRLIRTRWVLALLLLPLILDGSTHLLSDVTGGLTHGFRYGNCWLANLTGNALPTWFYMGDALGSFNSWMRLLSGLLFGVALVWLAFPLVDRTFHAAATDLDTRLARSTSGHMARE